MALRSLCRSLAPLSGVVLFLAALSPASASEAGAAAPSPASSFHALLDARAAALEPKLIRWRRDFHQHPELSNREVRTAKVIAAHLRALGLEVRTGVAKTGVVGLIRGARPGPTVALRADMDALPVEEQTALPFRSTARAKWNGQEVGVMHACGHDLHMAILMGTAEVLAGLRGQLAGNVKLIFQPAEEGPPAGEAGGAPLMVQEGVLENPKVDAIFGLHVFPLEGATLGLRPEGIMAAASTFRIQVRGRQTHGAMPWAGVDPVVASSQIVLGLQTLVSRQSDLTLAPAVVTVGTIHGGTRFNIIPEEVSMEGTLRTFDASMEAALSEGIRRTATQIAQASGAVATVELRPVVPVTRNEPSLAARMAPTLQRVAGARFDANVRPTTTSEDFAHYLQQVPGLFFFLDVTPRGELAQRVAPNHSPRFEPDEGALVTGVRALSSLAVDYLGAGL